MAVRESDRQRLEREGPLRGAVAAQKPRDEGLGWVRGDERIEVGQGAGSEPGRHDSSGSKLPQRADRTLGRGRGWEQAETDQDEAQEDPSFCAHVLLYGIL